MAFKNIDEVKDDHLHILWTSPDSATAQHMVLLYARNAKLLGWWKKITIIIWGAPQPLLFEDEAVHLQMELARQAGVEISACIGCARNLGLIEAFEKEGIEVEPWGERITLLMQNGKHMLTI